MAMGKRRRHEKQALMWVATNDLPRFTASTPLKVASSPIGSVNAMSL